MPLEKLVAQCSVTAVMSCGHAAVPQKLIVVQLVKVFTAFFGTIPFVRFPPGVTGL